MMKLATVTIDDTIVLQVSIDDSDRIVSAWHDVGNGSQLRLVVKPHPSDKAS